MSDEDLALCPAVLQACSPLCEDNCSGPCFPPNVEATYAKLPKAAEADRQWWALDESVVFQREHENTTTGGEDRGITFIVRRSPLHGQLFAPPQQPPAGSSTAPPAGPVEPKKASSRVKRNEQPKRGGTQARHDSGTSIIRAKYLNNELFQKMRDGSQGVKATEFAECAAFLCTAKSVVKEVASE